MAKNGYASKHFFFVAAFCQFCRTQKNSIAPAAAHDGRAEQTDIKTDGSDFTPYQTAEVGMLQMVDVR